MFGILKKLFIAIGKASEEANDTYEPQYNGQWKNKARGNKEDWVWVEKAEKSVVNVFQLEDDYIIAVGTKPRPSAIESMECEDKRDQEILGDVPVADHVVRSQL